MRKSKNSSLKIALVIAAIAGVGVFIGSKKLHFKDTIRTENREEICEDSPNISSKLIELPAPISNRKELIIQHQAYTVSYNSDWKIPNWVAYELLAKELTGEAHRGDEFIPDPKVPEKHTAYTYDYSHSGFDRGHMIPAGDVKWSQSANDETFYLSNICPQNQNLNRGIWNSLEEQVRKWAKEKGKIYVVCGPIVSNNHKTIGEHKVAVPESFYKALLINENGQWYSLAFLFPNQSGNNLLVSYALSVNELEEKTKIDFFPEIPDEIEEQIEDTIDWQHWNSKR